MADKPFDRTIINIREKPLSRDINQAQSQQDYALRFVMQEMLRRRTADTNQAAAACDGWFPYSLVVVPQSPASMDVTVKAGVGFFESAADRPSGIGSIVGLDDLATVKPIVLDSDVRFTVPTAPAAGNSRIDIIEAKITRTVGNPQSRLVLDPVTGGWVPSSVNKTLGFTLDGSTGYVVSPAASTVALSYKSGAVAATGAEVEPPVTAGYVQIARINVGPSVVAIGKGDIVDRRKLLGQGGVVRASISWYQQWTAGVPVAAIRGVCAPPGVEFGLNLDSGSGARNAGTISVTGLGEITKAVLLVTARGHSGVPGGDITGHVSNAFFSGNTQIVGAATSGTKTVIAAGYVPVTIGVGQKIVMAGYEAIVASTGFNNVAAIDNVYWDAELVASYH